MIASTYGFIIAYWAGASWITEYDTTAPRPFSFTRSILPTLFRPRIGHTVRGGKSSAPHDPHWDPYRLYRLGISSQNLGLAGHQEEPQRHENDAAAPIKRPAGDEETERFRSLLEKAAQRFHVLLSDLPAVLHLDRQGTGSEV